MSRGKYARKRERKKQRALQKETVSNLSSQQLDKGKEEGNSTDHGDAYGKENELKGMTLIGILKRPSLTDYAIAAFTIVLAAVAIFQGVFTKNQLDVMRDDERAWLEFNVVSLPPVIEEGKTITLPGQVINSGKTPALNVDVKVFVEVLDAQSEVPLDYVKDYAKHASYNHATSGILFPTRSVTFSVMRRDNGHPVATAQEINSLQSGDSYIAIFGTITYKDVFDRVQTTNFCRWDTHTDRNANRMRTYKTQSCTAFNGVSES